MSSKFAAERNQRALLDLVSKPGNDVCADCKARSPRWASHNLGIFLCMNCASIHRKIGTHITKVKSVTMDSWNKEQIEVMKSIGNIASNSKYNPNESRHPPPANREESERDSELEKFIRWKYEFRRFMDTKPVASSTPRASAPAVHIRPRSTPAASVARRSSPLPPVPTSSTSNPATLSRTSEGHSTSAASHVAPPGQPSALLQVPTTPVPVAVSSPALLPVSNPASFPHPAPASVPAPPPARRPDPSRVSKHPVWDDMRSLASPGQPGLSTLHQSQVQVQPPSHAPPGSSTTSTFGSAATNGFPSTTTDHQTPGRGAGLPVFQSTSGPFPTQNTQPQMNMGNPFSQPLPGFQSQMSLNGTLFQLSTGQVQAPFGQLQSSSLSHSYTPPSAFAQQQQQATPPPQQFAPSSFPQQYGQSSHLSMQQPLQTFPQQPPMRGANNAYGTLMWQQQHCGTPPYGSWGGM